jgi:hypothetical protein
MVNIVNTSSSNECTKLISDGYQYFDEFKMLSINPSFGKVNNFVFGLIVILLFKKFFEHPLYNKKDLG